MRQPSRHRGALPGEAIRILILIVAPQQFERFSCPKPALAGEGRGRTSQPMPIATRPPYQQIVDDLDPLIHAIGLKAVTHASNANKVPARATITV
jgi:hypothetical protein